MQNTNELRIDIPVETSEKIEFLFSQYNAYLAILEYLARVGSLNESNKFFDDKWNEAVQIYIKLAREKAKADNQFHPDEEFNTYHFDFINHQLVYVK